MLKIYTLALVACALAFSNLASATTPVDVIKAGQSLLNNVTSTVLSELGGSASANAANGTTGTANVNTNANVIAVNPLNGTVATGADAANGTAGASSTPAPK